MLNGDFYIKSVLVSLFVVITKQVTIYNLLFKRILDMT